MNDVKQVQEQGCEESMAVHIACYRDAVSCCIRAEFKENIAMFALLILRKHRRRLSIST